MSIRANDLRICARNVGTPTGRVQLDRVKALLAQTDLSLADIAERCGFAHVEYLSVVFKKKTGFPPSQYRAQHRT